MFKVDEVYQKIISLEGQKSVQSGKGRVWVPAIANGGLRGLLEELTARGWNIIPPTDEQSNKVSPTPEEPKRRGPTLFHTDKF